MRNMSSADCVELEREVNATIAAPAAAARPAGPSKPDSDPTAAATDETLKAAIAALCRRHCRPESRKGLDRRIDSRRPHRPLNAFAHD